MPESREAAEAVLARDAGGRAEEGALICAQHCGRIAGWSVRTIDLVRSSRGATEGALCDLRLFRSATPSRHSSGGLMSLAFQDGLTSLSLPQ